MTRDSTIRAVADSTISVSLNERKWLLVGPVGTEDTLDAVADQIERHKGRTTRHVGDEGMTGVVIILAAGWQRDPGVKDALKLASRLALPAIFVDPGATGKWLTDALRTG